MNSRSGRARPECIHFGSVAELASAYRNGSLSPVEVTAHFLERIDRHDERINAFQVVDKEGAVAAAMNSEKRWRSGAPASPVDGIPVTVKDMIDCRGLVTRRGSLLTEGAPPAAEDAPAVARLRQAGAIILGKTNTCEFGWKGTTDSRLHGRTLNPWNERLTPGGSSGGAAASLAAGMSTLALATDGGGSIRNPASFTNLTGIKATYGRVPAFPPNPIGSLANVGPMARRVGDLAAMLAAIGAPDRRDWDSIPLSMPDLGRALAGADAVDALSGVRIGFSRRLGFAPNVDDEVGAIVEQACKSLEQCGATLTDLEPDIGDPTETFSVHWQVGVANALGQLPESQMSLLDPGLAAFVEIGKSIPLATYLAAQNDRIRIGRLLRQVHEEVDLLALPTTAVAAFSIDRQAPEGVEDYDWRQWSPFSYPFNLSRQPAMSVPAGFTRDGRPVGLQLVGDFLSEASLFRVAATLERRVPMHERHPSGFE